MAYDEHSGSCAETEEKEAILIFRMIRIIHEQGVVIGEDCLTFFERYSMLTFVYGVLALVPYEP